MSLYGEALRLIRDNKKIRDSGKVTAIPWDAFPRLSTVLPGIQKSQYTIISSGTKESDVKSIVPAIKFAYY